MTPAFQRASPFSYLPFNAGHKALFPCLFFLFLFSFSIVQATEPEDILVESFRDTIHQYENTSPRDPFTSRISTIQKDLSTLPKLSEKQFLSILLRRLNIPVESQILVFSTTSLQLSKISPRNPRAIYFSNDVYVGYVPGGMLEIIGIDPELGAIPYLLPFPSANQSKIEVLRSGKCMRCHASPDIGGAPGLLLRSVVPGSGGGSLDSMDGFYNGHSMPYAKRFGGWFITNAKPFHSSWANALGVMKSGEIDKYPLSVNQSFDWSKFPTQNSDALAHIVLQHQVGFVNRCAKISYLWRENEKASTDYPPIFDILEQDLINYILFLDEPELPESLSPHSPFAKAFMNTKSPLRKLDLNKRIFSLRCSFMIQSQAFSGLPKIFQNRLLHKLKSILMTDSKTKDEKFAQLSREEKRSIHQILETTLEAY